MGAPLWRKCVAEGIGTYFIVLFGTGSVACAIASGELQGLWQVASVWGFGISLAIYATAGVSGAHLNPAVSFAFAVVRPKDFPWRELGPYILSQLIGSILGSACVYATWHAPLVRMEDLGRGNGGVAYDRGSDASIKTAMAFGEYFPNPGAGLGDDIGPLGAVAIEAFGTSILMFMILALTDDRNPARPPAGMAPFFIGFTVSSLIAIFAPLTQAGWNPARDFGPRIIAVMAGWGSVAIPGPRSGFWAYIVGPLLGAPLGALAYDFLIRPGLPSDEPEKWSKPPAGAWAVDQALLQQVIKEACATCCPDGCLVRKDSYSGVKKDEANMAAQKVGVALSCCDV